jgi:Glycosyl hydrolase family 3 N terminal domain/Glycosyl hydrolase family 3 C-terminal domain
MDRNEMIEYAERLLASMTLDQKIDQMTQPDRAFITPTEVKEYHIGSVLSGGGSCPGANLPADWVAMNDAYWAASVEADDRHLGIPLLYGVDAIHGHNNVRGAVIFPHNIGPGAANDPDLKERVASVTASGSDIGSFTGGQRGTRRVVSFMAAWLPGSEGQGASDVPFGDADFQGKLSFSWPATKDDNLNLGDETYAPLFPYGYGLSQVTA